MVVLAFLCLVLGVVGFLLLVINRPARDAAESTDEFWHRLEEGDITPAEFERLKRADQLRLRVRGASK